MMYIFQEESLTMSFTLRGASSLEKGRGRAAFDQKNTFSLKTRNQPMNFAILANFGNPTCYFVSD